MTGNGTLAQGGFFVYKEVNMQIPLDQIVASKKPIRSTWSEEEMQQLVDSVKQWGVIQAVKLRPLDNDPVKPFNDRLFEIVDGTRRVEAANRAGLETIEATIEGMDDTTALIQSLIANMQREDMTPVDLATAIYNLYELTGWSWIKLGLACGKSESWIGLNISFAKDAKEIQSLYTYPGKHEKQLTEHHARAVRNIELPIDEKVKILKKAQSEDLGWAKTEQLAEAVKVADDLGNEDAKRALIEKEYSPSYHNPDRVRDHLQSAKDDGRKSASYTTKPPELPEVDEWEVLYEAADVLAAFNNLINNIPNYEEVAQLGKLSPEGQRFLSHRMETLKVLINRFKAKLDNGEYDNG